MNDIWMGIVFTDIRMIVGMGRVFEPGKVTALVNVSL